jgi:hypothetical protein
MIRRHLSPIEMAEEERRRILFEINNGDWSEEERREMLLDIESYVQGSVNKRQREERQEERLRLIELLQDHSRYGSVPVECFRMTTIHLYPVIPLLGQISFFLCHGWNT